jgi:23S rRNA pseudouridine955/2504/2580 synthase
MNRPILGDGKYGGSDAFLAGVELVKRVHLHARAIALPGRRGKTRTIEAPLPADLIGSWQAFGFDPAEAT